MTLSPRYVCLLHAALNHVISSFFSLWRKCFSNGLFNRYRLINLNLIFFFERKDFIYIFLERARQGKKRETSMCGCLLCAPYWGPGPQPRHVPWLGIEQMTLSFPGLCSIHWATPAREKLNFQYHTTSKWIRLQIIMFCVNPLSIDDLKHFKFSWNNNTMR